MVFEQLINVNWLERKRYFALFLGFCYSLIGILSAKLIFPSSAGIMAVAFTSLLIVPTLNKLLLIEENLEIREKKLSIRLLFKDHKDVFEIYFFLFLGIFFSFALVNLFVPMTTSLKLFAPQLKVAGLTGGAFSSAFFTKILLNNLLVLFVCFILSLVYGAGSVIFITWNASAWGVIFAHYAKDAAGFVGGSPFTQFFVIIIPALPHMFTEVASYFSAAVVGGVVSKAVLREKLFSEKFHHIITDALILLALGVALVVLAAVIETVV
ncbi:stage II sporulation protein M [Nanoarchaeota archaeon]